MFFMSYPELVLSGGELPTFCINRTEARYLHDNDIPAYFRHGITVRPGDIVFDAGANIGLFALAALQRSGGQATVYAFEPVPAIWQVLRLNAERFGPDRLKVFPFGLSRRRNRLSFSYFPRLPSWSSACVDLSNPALARTRYKCSLLADIESGNLMPRLRRLPVPLRALVVDAMVMWLMKAKVVRCEVRTLSEILCDLGIERIDLLKVDVEGAELDVLMSIEAADWTRIRQIVLELEHFSERAAEVVALLEMHGFRRIGLEQVSEAQRLSDVGMIYATTGERLPSAAAEASR